MVTLDQEMQKGKYTFYTQSLIGYNMEGSECFRCVSELVVHITLTEEKIKQYAFLSGDFNQIHLDQEEPNVTDLKHQLLTEC